MRRFCAPLLAGLGLAVSCILPVQASAATVSATPDNPAAVRVYGNVLHKINPRMPVWQSNDLARHLLINANRWKVDPNILVGLVSVESAWRTNARSWVGAVGLGQLMPGTAAKLGVDPHDPYQNLQGAARYLGGLLHRYRNSPHQFSLAFAAYNAGPKAVARYGGIPPYAETQNYVVKVMSAWHRIASVVQVPAKGPSAQQPNIAVIDSSPDVSYWSVRR